MGLVGTDKGRLATGPGDHSKVFARFARFRGQDAPAGAKTAENPQKISAVNMLEFRQRSPQGAASN